MLAAQPNLKRWTKAEYHRMAEIGLFQNQRVELIGGEIIQMAPQKETHSYTILKVTEALRQVFMPGHIVRVQLPLDFVDASEPEPDFAIAGGDISILKERPKTAVLIVEVSESTLDYDRGRKASLYAQNGVQDYWIINLVDRQLEVHRKPISDPDEPFGYRYDEVTRFKPGSFVTPLAAGQSKIAIADLLP